MELSREQELMQRIISKAWEDEAFKNRLIANPAQAIEDLTGNRINIPEGKTLVVRDQTSEEVIYINIPAAQPMEDVELNEEQLEVVAGGKGLRPEVGSLIYGGPNPWTTILVPPGDHPYGNNLSLSATK